MIQKLFTSFLILFCIANQLIFAQEPEYQRINSENVLPDTSQNRQNSTKDLEYKSKRDKKWDWKNFRVGGDFGLSFGSVTYVDISPAFGYWVIPQKLQLGISTVFIYQSMKIDFQRWKSFIYGGGAFADYVIWRGLFARGEFQMINKESYNPPYQRVNVPSLLLGAGYIQPIGEVGNFYIALLYDVLDSDESIYSHTFGDVPLVLKVGFGIGFPGGRRR